MAPRRRPVTCAGESSSPATISFGQNLVVEDLVPQRRGGPSVATFFWPSVPPCPSIRRPDWSPPPTWRAHDRHREPQPRSTTPSPTWSYEVPSVRSSRPSSTPPDDEAWGAGPESLFDWRGSGRGEASGEPPDAGDGPDETDPASAGFTSFLRRVTEETLPGGLDINCTWWRSPWATAAGRVSACALLEAHGLEEGDGGRCSRRWFQ